MENKLLLLLLLLLYLTPHIRRAVRGWGVIISEDATQWIGLLQYNPSTIQRRKPAQLLTYIYKYVFF